jgi:hypothetical protein
VSDSLACKDSRTVWRVCVCLVLIASVLYNPFFALKIQSDGLAYASLARHRSTVGSSEMQQPSISGAGGADRVPGQDHFGSSAAASAGTDRQYLLPSPAFAVTL